jgi:DUF2934 family protein
MSTVATPPLEKTRKARALHAVIAGAPAPTAESARQITNEEIAARAYELYCERGAEDGHDLDDWLRAEEELRGHRRSPISES